MENLSVNKTSTEASVEDVIERMITDIKEADMDSLKAIFESMYPVIMEDVEGNEGEQVRLTVDFKEAPGVNLKEIF